MAETVTAECAVCWQETEQFAALPCCTAPAGSSMQYCVRCIEIICESGPGGVGRCPTCRGFIKKAGAPGTFTVADRVERCAMCQQDRTIVGEVRGAPVCDACLLGVRLPLRYECERCHRNQRIPHPMYRYQQTAQEFGNNTWACRVGCGDFTHWRIIEADADKVPDEDAPPGWGRREDWLARIREQRRLERAGGGAGRPRPAPRPLRESLGPFVVAAVALAYYAWHGMV